MTVAGTPAGPGATASPGPAGLFTSAVGEGPAVLLLHGVGIGPASFAPLASLVAGAGFRAVVVHRPGYGAAAAQGFLPPLDQVGLLASLVGDHSEDPLAGVVGVSGGATLALLLAARLAATDDMLVPVVAHEPLLGPLAAALHHRVRRAVSALGPAGRPAPPIATTGFVRRLAGEATWGRLPASERAEVDANSALIAAEARAFADLALTGADLARLRPSSPLVTTVGSSSGGERRSAATVLASLARARALTVPDAGHLAHVDAPAAFAAVALAALGASQPFEAVP
jgi:pimeloyl-ACP methyl ester carboxylesterase